MLGGASLVLRDFELKVLSVRNVSLCLSEHWKNTTFSLVTTSIPLPAHFESIVPCTPVYVPLPVIWM